LQQFDRLPRDGHERRGFASIIRSSNNDETTSVSKTRTLAAATVLAGSATLAWWASAQPNTAASAASAPKPASVNTVPGMPPVPDPKNLYSETGANRLSPAVAGALERVYVPNRSANTVSVIDPATLKVVKTFPVGINPQHVVPSWDLKTLWVANNAEGRTDGSLTPVDPLTGKPGAQVMVDDPYNMYWSPDGQYAIVVAEAYKRLDFRDPRTMEMKYSIATPECAGINHADFSIDGRSAFFTCEFNGSITKIDLVNRKVLATLKLSQYFNRPDALALIAKPGKKPKKVPDPSQLGAEICTTPGMPQDVRASPDGKTFYVADMMADGVHVVDGESFKQTGFIATGVGAHGLYPSRDGKSLYVANRGSNLIHGKPGGPGSVSVIDFATAKVQKTWPIPGGGSPDMGNVSADGKYLWLSGRYDNVVYRFDTETGAVDQVKVGREPHGLTVWPQPGRYSLGHTGNLR
jgi:YVTN family beta-propeller protein